MKILISCIFLLPFLACTKFINVSKAIEKHRNYDSLKIASPFFHELRKKIYLNHELSFINLKNDTVYILESYLLEEGVRTGLIWNKEKIAGYTFSSNKRINPYIEIADEKIRKLLIENNTETILSIIRKGNNIHSNQYYFSKVVFMNKGFNITGFKFWM